jgi:hypothetical protein
MAASASKNFLASPISTGGYYRLYCHEHQADEDHGQSYRHHNHLHHHNLLSLSFYPTKPGMARSSSTPNAGMTNAQKDARILELQAEIGRRRGGM